MFLPGRSQHIVSSPSSQVLNSRTIASLCYEGLLSQHPITLDFIPSLASHWFISEDKMQFKFRINPDARWWDGMPVTSDDVIATWDLMMDETILEPSSQLVYEKYERPVAESKYIVSVTSKSLNWRNLLYFSASMSLHPHHILKDLDGTDYLEKYAFSLIPGTGPYKIEDKNIKLPLDAAIQNNLREATTNVLSTLTPREERVLRMRFGIGMNTDHTLEEVGQQFSVTRERIRQIEAKGLRKLKHPSRSRKLRSFLDN